MCMHKNIYIQAHTHIPTYGQPFNTDKKDLSNGHLRVVNTNANGLFSKLREAKNY